MATSSLEMQKELDCSNQIQIDVPHLVTLRSERLSTALILHPLPKGRIILGSNQNSDITVIGPNVKPVHCTIENYNGVVTLYLIEGSVKVDGVSIKSSVKLNQGCLILIGELNYMRFYNPVDKNPLKLNLSSLKSPLDFINYTKSSENLIIESVDHKPPIIPRRSPIMNLTSDNEISFLGKLNKFEMLARQNHNFVSPKVFPAGSLTTNVPADQILGYSKHTLSQTLSLTKINNIPLRNLTNFDNNRLNIINYDSNNHLKEDYQLKIDGKIKNQANGPSKYHSTSPSSSSSSPSNNNHQIQNCSNELSNNNVYYNEENSKSTESPYCLIKTSTATTTAAASTTAKSIKNNYDLMSTSLTCEITTSEFDNYNRTFDMSQSLILSKTNMKKYLQVDKTFEVTNSSNNLCNNSFNEQLLLDNNNESINYNIKRIKPSSPAFNRNQKYVEQKNNSSNRIKYPLTNGVNNISRSCCSLDEYHDRQIDAECKRKLAQEQRVQDQEIEKQEKKRLEEILAMCTEYEKQNSHERPRQPNRIITNGSLPRDKRLTSNNSSHHNPINLPTYQNDIVNNKMVVTSSPLPFNEQNNNINEMIHSNTFCYQNQDDSNHLLKDKQQQTTPTTNFSTIQLNGKKLCTNSVPNYENVTIHCGQQNTNNINNNNSSSNNRTVNFNINNKNGQFPSEGSDKKFSISNDDLFEAIEQLSVLTKSKDIYITPKKNNFEYKNIPKLDDINKIYNDNEKKDKEKEEEDRKKYIAFLKNEKIHIVEHMDTLKRNINDLETQEEEVNREYDLEKALLNAEYESESLKLTTDEAEKISVQLRINNLEEEMIDNTTAQVDLQTEAKCRVEKAERLCNQLESKLKLCKNDDEQKILLDKLYIQQDVLETERKTFEDLEFHHLENEASKLATREELQRYLSELTGKIETRKSQLNHLELQQSDAKAMAAKELKSLEQQKLIYVQKLEENRNRLRAIDEELLNIKDVLAEKQSPNKADFDRISKVTIDSPIVNNNETLGKKTIESFKEIERNRQRHLAKQGSQVISEERRRVEELKRKVQDEVRSQWNERKMNCSSFNSVESGEETSSNSTNQIESGSGSSDSTDIGNNEKILTSKLTEFSTSSPGPSNNSYTFLQNDNVMDSHTTSIEEEKANSSIDNTSLGRPISQTSSEIDSIGSLKIIKYRERPKQQQRPLTRYLPIKSESLDLRYHIETAGHQLSLIQDVFIDTITCKGYLSKMSKKFHHWNKRWFVFDRKKKILSYYSDNSSKKIRGLIYFQSIEEVYVDHMNTIRSPQPSLSFIIKTTTRTYHLMAPSPEAMRVWVDVVFTGAEGYREFDHELG